VSDHPRYIVKLRGGTILRLKGGPRGPECEYDKLNALLDACEVWQRPGDWPGCEAAKWAPGVQSIVGACMETSSLLPEILGEKPDAVNA
jgi:hypothetical protein